MLKVLSVIGTRPEAVKMAPVIKALDAHQDRVRSVVCATGQHREMFDQALHPFGITPDYNLDLMEPGQTLAASTSRILAGVDAVLAREEPDWVLVQGDTTTVMAAGLAAYFRRIAVGHVEAGLRTGDKFSPFPEEMNRVIADRLADLYFAPTQAAADNLLAEGCAADQVLVTGNTGIDALYTIVKQVRARPMFQHFGIRPDRKLVLVTVHRRENHGAPLASICRALAAFARRHADEIHMLLPVHMNPRVSGVVRSALGDIANITLVDPLPYTEMVAMLDRSYMILTDSGGIQEEAPSLGKPVLVLRESTERPEAVAAGAARLVGTDEGTIVHEAERLLQDRQHYAAMANAGSPYGDGRASERIVAALCNGLRYN